MKKIPCLIIQDHKNKIIPPIEEMQINPVCQWVMDGKGVPTRKFDGTACAIINGRIYTRFDAKLNKKGKRKAIPEGAIACEETPDPFTGHWPHWRPVREPEDQYIIEALHNSYTQQEISTINFTTFEATGPKINSNNEGTVTHEVFAHKIFKIIDYDTKEITGNRTLQKIFECLESRHIEGIVFHHPDGRMAKIRRVDFGLAWPVG